MRHLLLFILLFLSSSNTTFAQKRIARENIEWSDIYIPGANKTDLPHVLLIGNSIVRGYHHQVEQLLKEKTYVARLSTSKSLGDPALLEEIEQTLKNTHFDIIHFNNGLHGFDYTEEEYDKNFPKLLKILSKYVPATHLIWASTTPVRTGSDCKELAPITERLKKRNQIALKHINSKGINTNDLWSTVINHPEYYAGGDGTHPIAKGYTALANQVASMIDTKLTVTKAIGTHSNRVKKIRETLANPHSEKVIVVAHRGDWRSAPENSLGAIEGAIQMKVDVVELDVKRTKDGKLILMHDTSLDRTSTGKGDISGWTLDHIKTLNLKHGANETGYKIPTLEEAMLVAKGRIMVNLDHAYSYFDEIYEILKKTGTTKQVIMKGAQPLATVKKEFGKYLNKVLYMPVIYLDKEGADKEVEVFLKKQNPQAFEFIYANESNPLPKEMEKRVKGKGLIWYNTLWPGLAGNHDDDLARKDPEKGYGYLIDYLGARILQTDHPAYLLEYLRKRNMHD